jgi:RNA polymerase sigma factor (sigma-70 family)
MLEDDKLLPHLFRTEYSKIVSVLYKRFGFEQMEIAEDIAADTFLDAAQTWPFKGLPVNPVAWLHSVAKNKAKSMVQRNAIFENRVSAEYRKASEDASETELDLSSQNIIDSQLQMMFAICHPSLATEAQIALSLRILCGFGIEEIATAFLSNKETINKRLYRAKEKLRAEKVSIVIPPVGKLEERMSSVLTTIYLLFNEGYYSLSQDTPVRKELCFEAIRLGYLLNQNEQTSLPEANALLALMCFQASRLDARMDESGGHILYSEQDFTRWDTSFINKGIYYLHQASRGEKISKYHLQATIAYLSTDAKESEEKWTQILLLYDQLLQIDYSPVAALNRVYALSKVKGKQEAVIAAEKLQLTNDHFYFALLGDLYTGIDHVKARENFKLAFEKARTLKDKNILIKKLKNL